MLPTNYVLSQLQAYNIDIPTEKKLKRIYIKDFITPLQTTRLIERNWKHDHTEALEITRKIFNLKPSGILCDVKVKGLKDEIIRAYGYFDEDLYVKTLLKADLYEIALYCDDTLRNLNGDGSTDWVQLAFTLTEQRGCGYLLAASISNFGITDQKILTELAFKCLHVTNGEAAAHLEKFNITDQQTIINLAKFSVNNCYQVGFYFRDFGIQDQNLRIALAKDYANLHKGSTAKYIQYFDIQDQQALINIAKMCLTSPEAVHFVHNFGIKDKKALIDLAMLSATHAPGQTANSIENFEIEDQAALFEIAMQCARLNPYGTVAYIENFKICSQKELVKIAKECAKGSHTLYSIVKLKIINEQDWIDIAKESAKYQPEETCIRANDLHVKNKQALFEIAKICAEAREVHAYFNLSTTQKFICRFITWSEKPNDLERIPSYLGQHEFNIKENQALINEIEDEHARNQTQFWLNNTIQHFAMDLPSEQQKWIDQHKFLLHIQMIKDPKLRWRLTRCLFELPQTDLPNTLHKSSRKKETASVLIGLISAAFKAKGLAIKEVSNKFYTDAVKLNILLDACVRLVLEDNPCTQKLLDQILNDPKSLKYVSLLFQLKEKERLINFEGSMEELIKQMLNEKVGSILSINDQNIEKFNQIFNESRNPAAFSVYVAGLKKLNNSHLTSALTEVVTALLENRYEEFRYENVHLKQISTPILEKWKINTMQTLKTVSKEARKIDMRKWLYEKLVVDNHLPIQTDEVKQLCSLLAQNYNENILLKLQELVKGTEFENDIKALLQKNEVKNTRVIVNTDNFVDILLCGTDILGSCQRVDGDPNLNCGLLGYLMNGQTRLLAIKTDPKGPIQARCLIRLLLDNDKPVLFRERFYPSTITREEEDALNSLAKEIANELKIDVVYFGTENKYPNPVRSIGGKAPYEYVDAGKVGIQKSTYQIDDACYLCTPRFSRAS